MNYGDGVKIRRNQQAHLNERNDKYVWTWLRKSLRILEGRLKIAGIAVGLIKVWYISMAFKQGLKIGLYQRVKCKGRIKHFRVKRFRKWNEFEIASFWSSIVNTHKLVASRNFIIKNIKKIKHSSLGTFEFW